MDRELGRLLMGMALAWSLGSQAGQGQSAAPEGSVPVPSEDAFVAALQIVDRLDATADDQAKRSLVGALSGQIEKAQAMASDDPRLLYLNGRLQALMGRAGEGITLLRKYVETSDGRTDWRGHRALGDLLVDQFPQLAKYSYDQADGLKSNEPSVLIGLSVCAQKLGHGSEAVGLARRVVELDSRPRYQAQLARLLLSQRQFEEAQRAAASALEQGRSDVRNHPATRSLIYELDRYLQLLLEVMQSRSVHAADDAELYVAMAKVIRERGDHAQRVSRLEALRRLEAGLDAMGERAPVTLREAYGVALAESGLNDEAIVQFERIQALEPAHAVSREWLAKLRASSGTHP